MAAPNTAPAMIDLPNVVFEGVFEEDILSMIRVNECCGFLRCEVILSGAPKSSDLLMLMFLLRTDIARRKSEKCGGLLPRIKVQVFVDSNGNGK